MSGVSFQLAGPSLAGAFIDGGFGGPIWYLLLARIDLRDAERLTPDDLADLRRKQEEVKMETFTEPPTTTC